jgi:hypothetical protein
MAAGGSSSPAWPQDVAVPRRQTPKRAAVPVCEAWVMPLAEVAGWFAAADVGHVLVYARGPFLVQGATSAFVRDKALAGLAHPTQEPIRECVGNLYKVKKLGEAKPPAAPDPDCLFGAPDAAIETIFDLLERAAEQGRPCPSDAELARAAGLATRAQAQWRVTQLRKAGRIASAPVAQPSDIGRVVTIVASGKHTLAPKGWRPC